MSGAGADDPLLVLTWRGCLFRVPDGVCTSVPATKQCIPPPEGGGGWAVECIASWTESLLAPLLFP